MDRCPGIQYVDRCKGTPRGEVPKLSKENRRIVEFFQKLTPWLFNGMGGYNMNVLREAYEIYQVPKSQWELLTDRISVLVTTHAKITSEEAKEEKDNQ